MNMYVIKISGCYQDKWCVKCECCKSNACTFNISYLPNAKFERESILKVQTFHTVIINSRKSISPPPVVSKCLKHLSVQGVQSRSK